MTRASSEVLHRTLELVQRWFEGEPGCGCTDSAPPRFTCGGCGVLMDWAHADNAEPICRSCVMQAVDEALVGGEGR